MAATGLRALIDQLPEDLARQAVTHASWARSDGGSYGRLAFLGDSVLGLAISSAVYPRFPDRSAGGLTAIRAQAISRAACAAVAPELGIAERLRHAAPGGEGRSVEALLATRSVLGECVEAVIGACYLTHGFESTRKAVVEAFSEAIEEAIDHPANFKSALQELLARTAETVDYEVLRESGPPHDRLFEVRALVDGEVVGEGSGKSKKEAEQSAAARALEGLSR